MLLQVLILIFRFSSANYQKFDIWITKDENYSLEGQSIIFPLDHHFSDQEVFQPDNFNQSIQQISQSLVKFMMEFNIQENFKNVFQLVNADQEETRFCSTYTQEIICNKAFKNLLIDNQFIELKLNPLVLYTNNSDCLTAFAVDQNIYLLECKDTQGKILKLIDQNSQLINQILIPAQFNNSQFVIQSNKTYIVYEVQKDKCNFTFVIVNNQKLEVVQYYYLDGNQISSVIGDIVKIQVKENNNLIVLFEQLIVEINITNFHIYKIRKSMYSTNTFFGFSSKFKQICFIIDYTQEKEIQKDQKRIIINPKNQVLKNAFVIQQSFLLFYGNKIFISNNEMINQTIYEEFQEMVHQETIPIIFGITKTGLVKVYQIFDLPYSINANYPRILFVIKIQNLNVQQNIIYNLKDCFSEGTEMINQPQKNLIHILSDKNILLWNQFDQSKYLQDTNQINTLKYYQGQFWQIVGYKDFDNILTSFNNKKIVAGLNNHAPPYLLVYIYQAKVLLQFYENKTLAINNLMLQNYKYQFYNFNVRNCLVFTSTSNSNVIIIEDYKKINIYQLLDQEIKQTQIKIKLKIKSIYEKDNILRIFLENCTQFHIYMDNLQISQINNSLQQNCTYFDQLKYKTIFYNKKQIEIKQTIKEVYTFENIIEFSQLSETHYLMFQLIQNKIQLYLYLIVETKLIPLREITTNEYQIHYPLQYKMNMKYQLALLVFKQNKDSNSTKHDNFVLIYDLLDSQCFQLLKVIPIDNVNSQFSFTNENKFINIYNNEILIENLEGVDISMKEISLGFDTYIKTTKIEVELKSLIQNQLFNVPFRYVYVNNNQTLQKKTESQKNYFTLSSNKQSKILKLNNIFGKIDSVIYNKSGNIIVLSSNHIEASQLCDQYIVDACLALSGSLKIKFFSKNIEFLFQKESIKLLIQYQEVQDGSLVYYVDNMNNLQKILVSEKGELISQQSINYNYPENDSHNLKMIGQMIITQISQKFQISKIKNSSVEIFFINSKNKLDYIQVIYRNQQYCIISYDFNFNQPIIIITIVNQNLNITFERVFQQEEILDPEWTIFNQKFIQEIQIIDFIDEQNGIKTDVLFCFQLLQCYRMQITINKENQQFQSKILNVIRYGNDKILKESFLLNYHNLILHTKNQHDSTWQLYNLNQNDFIIDSFSTNPINVNTQFYHYNQTHFIQCQKEQGQIFLKRFMDYQILCDEVCDDQEFIVTLQNNVSSLNLTFNHLELDTKQVNLQLYIILINTILIFIINIKKQFLRQQRKNKLQITYQ